MNEDMPRKRPPFLSREKTRHGRHVWYFKRAGKRVRLPDEYGSKEFNEAYAVCLTGEKPLKIEPASSSLAWLVGRYKESNDFKSLRPSTRRMRDNVLKAACENAGKNSFAKITRKHIEEAMGRRKPHAANNFRKIMSRVFQWAVKQELLAINPCDSVDPVKAQTDGHHTWTIEQVEKYRKKHAVGTKARLALDLLLFVGLRRSDVVRVGKQHMKNGVISIRTEKTGSWVHVAVFSALQKSIDATETGDLAFLTTDWGQPFKSAASFGNWFRDRCNEAFLPIECRAHGLRKAGATIAADNGATVHELMAMYGWSKSSMAEVYTRESDKRRLARGAAERIANNV
ncbi:tyrosine-type recombinase/integrase [Mesorhizobium sp. BE184]|uniref:tyrosine-type recombinase/integrase n=1 Tax=Mesorhizobium sp. BE184 TaxID=2817714 RepID=UPI0028654E31|nr:tyrosine-type recombinase/integrase [Mesorhizobium sp. BE184]MDR7032387.1 integrase [Mesorhizobium sp. BE184]